MISVNLHGGNCRLEIEKNVLSNNQVTVRVFNGWCIQFISNLIDFSSLEVIETQEDYLNMLYVKGVGGFVLKDHSDASKIKEFIKENAQ